MRWATVTVRAVVLALAALVCSCRERQHPTPHISGPHTACVGDTVVFIATYHRELSVDEFTLWDWGDTSWLPGGLPYTSRTDTGVHVYDYAGTFIVKAFSGSSVEVNNWQGYHYYTYDCSDPSNPCTLHVLNADRLRQRRENPGDQDQVGASPVFEGTDASANPGVGVWAAGEVQDRRALPERRRGIMPYALGLTTSERRADWLVIREPSRI